MPPAPLISAGERTAAMASLGCPDSRPVYPSLKSRYLIMTPLAKAARSGLVLPPLPRTVAGWVLETVSAICRAILPGSLW